MIRLLILLVCVFSLITCKQNDQVEKSASPASNSLEKSEDAMSADLDLSKYGMQNSEKNSLGGLKVGDKAPNFSAKDHDGIEFLLEDALNESDVLMVFYRAYWCPYCSKHLQAFQDQLVELKAKGIQVIAISPEKPEFAQQTIDKAELTIPVLYDQSSLIMKSYKVAFEVTNDYNSKIKGYVDKNIAEINGDQDNMLPVPATYLVGKDGVIKYAHYDPDYSNRSEISDILASLN